MLHCMLAEMVTKSVPVHFQSSVYGHNDADIADIWKSLPGERRDRSEAKARGSLKRSSQANEEEDILEGRGQKLFSMHASN